MQKLGEGVDSFCHDEPDLRRGQMCLKSNHRIHQPHFKVHGSRYWLGFLSNLLKHSENRLDLLRSVYFYLRHIQHFFIAFSRTDLQIL